MECVCMTKNMQVGVKQVWIQEYIKTLLDIDANKDGAVMSYWSTKEAHGLHWGNYVKRLDAKDMRIHIDNYEPCYNIGQTDGSRHCFQFGNTWASKPGDPFYDKPFQHPRHYTHDNWHFIDNPEIPQFLWSNPANPKGSKDWVRFVKGNLFTNPQQHSTNGASRCNDLLREFSGGRTTAWHEIVTVKPVSLISRKRVLICPVSDLNYPNYYNTTAKEWLTDVIQWLLDHHYDYDIRHKPSRKSRIGNQLTDQLQSGRYCATISQHSAAAMESIIAGVPAVTTGPHPAGELATPWEEFTQGHLRAPELIEVVNWIEIVLGNVRHKRELFEGTWK